MIRTSELKLVLLFCFIFFSLEFFSPLKAKYRYGNSRSLIPVTASNDVRENKNDKYPIRRLKWVEDEQSYSSSFMSKFRKLFGSYSSHKVIDENNAKKVISHQADSPTNANLSDVYVGSAVPIKPFYPMAAEINENNMTRNRRNVNSHNESAEKVSIREASRIKRMAKASKRSTRKSEKATESILSIIAKMFPEDLPSSSKNSSNSSNRKQKAKNPNNGKLGNGFAYFREADGSTSQTGQSSGTGSSALSEASGSTNAQSSETGSTVSGSTNVDAQSSNTASGVFGLIANEGTESEGTEAEGNETSTHIIPNLNYHFHFHQLGFNLPNSFPTIGG